jgi:hypothetical protein
MPEQKKADSALISAAQTAFQTPFGALLQLLPENGGGLWVDGSASPPVILETKPMGRKPDCVWRAVSETLLRVLEGERALESAFVAGRLKIAGDMSVMTRLKLGARK